MFSPDLLNRSATVTIQELPSGDTLATADGTAGTWHCVARESGPAIANATRSAMFGDEQGGSDTSAADAAEHFYVGATLYAILPADHWLRGLSHMSLLHTMDTCDAATYADADALLCEREDAARD